MRSTMPAPIPGTGRRGVLLLVVLSVLTLFCSWAPHSLVVLSSRARSTAKAFRNLAASQAQASHHLATGPSECRVSGDPRRER